ncbi:DNA/RNA non-specific endonuclease [Salinisphaera aquimarina]|uniref:DNA/RNA non-specific endonuclease n=1 Tax=Salinisphaera aquimarina TaxID=2094031 RepID=A0ABV7EUS1_9GAMM
MLLLLVFSLLAGCTSTGTDRDSTSRAAIGWPTTAQRSLRILRNDGFTIGYDETAGRASWVAYRVTPVAQYRRMPRPDFRQDPRLDRPASLSAYAGPVYDRGHLAPNYAISQLYGVEAQRQTFYYSNIAPQRPRLNQLLWQRLEEIEVDDIAPRVGSLRVFVGPVPGAEGEPPSAFYRIWLARSPGHDDWQAMALLVPQRVRGDERLDAYLVSIDRIEALTGLDFMASLSVAEQRRLEAGVAPAARFGFAKFACQPARYSQRWRDRDLIRLQYNRCDGPLAGADNNLVDKELR